jgi:hypothetical protein
MNTCSFFLFIVVLLVWNAVDTTIHIVVNGDWVDPDTPQEYRHTKALTRGDHREFKLVRVLLLLLLLFLLRDG